MQVFVRIRSEYFNEELSIHRLNMSGLTLIPSLLNQTDRDFQVMLEYVENDPHVERRTHHFNKFHRVESIKDVERVEVFVDDDVFLHQRFIQTCRHTARSNRIPRTLVFPNGYVLRDGHLFQAEHMMTVAYGVVHRGEPGADDTSSMEIATRHPSWIYVDHVNKQRPKELDQYHNAVPLKTTPWWRGFSFELVDQSSQTTAILATAEGYDFFPEHRQLTFRKQGTKGRK